MEMLENFKLSKDGGIFVPSDRVALPKALAGRKPKGWGIWANWGVDVLDSRGVLQDRKVGPCRSFLRNWGRLVRNHLLVDDTTNEDITDDTGVARQPRIIQGALASVGSGFRKVVRAAGIIKFGSGTTAVTSTDFNVETQIATFGDMTVTTTVITEDAVESEWKHEGSAANTSGGPVTINNMGLFAKLSRATTTGEFNAMGIYDIVSPGVVVADTLTALGRYTITVAV